MDSGSIWCMFESFNKKYFWSELDKVKLSWSPRMTLCAGKTAYKVRKRTGTSCSIRLSQPLLSQRPRSDTVNTLLHEMIHAYLHVTQGLNYRDSHGPEFRSHMKRINALEGAQITIYHNFRKEVDKYRIHVYRCDGPCVSRRPFFGVLRRAIERPPGPTDKWWARHGMECGGTFHKIEGPGAVPTDVQATVTMKSAGTSKGKSRNSLGDNNRVSGMSCKENHINQRKQLISNKTKERKNFDEDAILKRIRGKYSDVKQTILLSKDESKHLNMNQQESRYAHPSPFGNYVEGKINYSYQVHCPEKIKISKYLNRYREARKDAEPPLSSRSYKSEQHPQSNKKKLVDSVSYSKKLKPKCKSKESANKTFNYNYQSKTPEKIKLEKYINKYRITQGQQVFDDSETAPGSSSSTHNTNSIEPFQVKMGSSHVGQDILSYPGPSKTTLCPVCNIEIPFKEYEQHLGECFGNDLEFDIDMSEKNKNSANGSSESGYLSEVKETEGHFWDEFPAAKCCSNCGSKVLVAEMKLHLQYCVDSDDETDSIESPQKSGSQSTQGGEWKHATGNNTFDANFVSCPSCMEKVQLEKIQGHLDECLKFISEEF